MTDMPSRETVDAEQRRRTGLALMVFLLAIAVGVVVMASAVVDQLSLPDLATSTGQVVTSVSPG